MAGSTANFDLYIWEAADEKRETISQMASNSQKIDAALNDLNNSVDALDDDIAGVSSDLSQIHRSIETLKSNTSALREEVNDFKNIESWKTLSLSSVVSAYGAGFVTPSYRKDPHGMVSVRGLINFNTSGTPTGDVDLGTLPAGYRPAGMIVGVGWASLPGGEEKAVRLNIRTDGRIQAKTGETGAVYLSLDSIVPFEGV